MKNFNQVYVLVDCHGRVMATFSNLDSANRRMNTYNIDEPYLDGELDKNAPYTVEAFRLKD